MIFTDINQRFGDAIVSSGTLKLNNKKFADDFGPVEEGCTCVCCRTTDQGGLGLTRAYMHHITSKETVGAHLYVKPCLCSLRH
jgi:queuine tRNA-ribosyltransferase